MRHALASLLASLASKADSLSSRLSPDPPAQGNASPHAPHSAHGRTATGAPPNGRTASGGSEHQQPAPPLSPPDKRQRTPVHLDLRTGTLTVRTRHGWQPLTLASLGLPTHPPIDAGSGHPARPDGPPKSGHAAGQKPGGMGRRAWELDTDMESLDPPSWEAW